MDDKKREELSKALKKYLGARGIVAKRADVSVQYVYMVLAGKRNNSTILTIACEVLEELEKKEAALRERQKRSLNAVMELGAL